MERVTSQNILLSLVGRKAKFPARIANVMDAIDINLVVSSKYFQFVLTSNLNRFNINLSKASMSSRILSHFPALRSDEATARMRTVDTSEKAAANDFAEIDCRFWGEKS